MAQYKYNNINTIKQQAIVRKGEFQSFVIQVFESANEWHVFFSVNMSLYNLVINESTIDHLNIKYGTCICIMVYDK